MERHKILLFVYITIIIIIVVIFCGKNIFYNDVILSKKDNFSELILKEDNNLNNIDFYVITLHNPIRLLNIEKQNEKLNVKINIIDAVNGIYINQTKLLEDKILADKFSDIGNVKRNKEIGCFMSHEKIYNSIKNNENKKKYSIIFEDDFNIISENIVEKLNSIIENISDIEFDILFLGNTFDNKGTEIKDCIYSIDKNKYTIGNFAYLINNKNINKILDLVKPIDSPIDNKIDTLIKNNKLNCIVVYPNIFNYMAEITSQIL
jgi:GR25 family glycosyltransferase involved in LPS biosynthesis